MPEEDYHPGAEDERNFLAELGQKMEFNAHAIEKIEAKVNWLATQMKKNQKGFKSEPGKFKNDVLDWMVDCSDDPGKYKKQFFGDVARKKKPDTLPIEAMTYD